MFRNIRARSEHNAVPFKKVYLAPNPASLHAMHCICTLRLLLPKFLYKLSKMSKLHPVVTLQAFSLIRAGKEFYS